jgi:hypothetical protein
MAWMRRYSGVKIALSALFKPRQNLCQIVSNDFGLYGFEFWKTGNTSELWKWSKIQFSEFLNFSERLHFIGYFGDFGKFK